MEFRIADTFTDSLSRLTGDEQKAVKTTAFDLQSDPASSRARSRGRCERKAMIVKTHPLSVKRQAELLEISRSNVYYLAAPTPERDLALRLM